MNVPLSSVQLQASGVDWLPLALTLVMMALIFLALRLLSALRTQAEKELRRLYQQDVALYLERLEHNRRLKLVFRKSVLLLYRLEGYMKLGDNQMIRQIIAQLDQMSLQPRDKLLFLQDRLSFFVSTGEWDEARASRDSLVSFLHKSKADRQAQYQKVIADARPNHRRLCRTGYQSDSRPTRPGGGHRRPGSAGRTSIPPGKALSFRWKRRDAAGLSKTRSKKLAKYLLCGYD